MVRNLVILITATLLLSACSLFNRWFPRTPPCSRAKYCYATQISRTSQTPQPLEISQDDEHTISLLHPTSRTIVHCYTTPNILAEKCAQLFEKEGFVRFREIPYKTADFDFLKRGTYPTRRWREGERTPRW